MRILVSGASGFIGHHVAAAVQEGGHQPYPLVRQGSAVDDLAPWKENFRTADLRDPAALEAAVAGLDAVIHLAGLTRARSRAVFDRVNGAAVGALARACHRAGGIQRLLLVSSLAAAGPSGDRPRRESDRPAPVSDYGRSKLLGEEQLRQEARDLAWTIVRPPIVYGPRDRDLLPVFRMARRGLVPVVGGARRFSVVYGPDLARCIVALALHPRAAGRVVFAAEPRAYEFREIVGAVARAIDRKARILAVPALAARLLAAGGSLVGRFRRRPPFLTLAKLPEVLAPGWACATDEIEALLDGFTWTPLEEGCRHTAAWYRERGWI